MNVYILVDPIGLYVSEDFKVLFHEMHLIVQETGKITELFELILLNSIHPDPDVFCALLAVVGLAWLTVDFATLTYYLDFACSNSSSASTLSFSFSFFPFRIFSSFVAAAS